MLPSTTSSPVTNPHPKINYLDYTRVLLTLLVILHHVCITYGAPGGWYFRQPTTQLAALFGLTLFVATNQSFFMGLFFLLSAYFVEPSYQRKGARAFVVDRLKRLGIPLVFYSLVLSPILNFLIYRYGHHQKATFGQFLTGYDDWIDSGVLWFVAALLLFNLLYVLLRQRYSLHYVTKLPPMSGILLFALVISAVSFLVRLVFPVGWVIPGLGFQLCYFPQYIALFAVGIVARQNKWLDGLSRQEGKRFSWLALGCVGIGFPLLFVVSTKLGLSMKNFSGGWNSQSLFLCLWEQLTGISISVALLSYSKRYWNEKLMLLDKLARSAYSTYIFHPLIVVGLSLLVAGLALDPLLKLGLVAPLAIIGSFLVGRLVLMIPGADTVL
ncbi:acyltransferase [Spirosoma sp. RP8]|uniref:Acyltransferase n=1 Tax=Spirosoma liriopis TaxID=2937440 RepID=A0ABT0HN40_9BACT|nr:acyltransferase [Spirosoma liriopis]MCK8493581.1 acyltransferase [Spirosoma liriopis]